MVDMDTLVSLCKRRGFIFQSSEIYGGLGSAWDYGPLGVELKRNVRNLWWRDTVHLRRDVLGLEAAVLMHPRVWEASGHLERFSDPMVDCRECKRRFRADHVDDAAVAPLLPGQEGEQVRDPGRRGVQALRDAPEALSGVRQGGADRAPPVQHDAEDVPRTGRGSGRRDVPPPGDRPGHVRQLRERAAGDAAEAALRHRPDRPELPQRDHAGELHLPDARVRADGARVLREPPRHGGGAAGRRVLARALDRREDVVVPAVRDPRREPAPPGACQGRAGPLRQAHGRHRVPVRHRLERAGGDRQPHRLRPQAPRRGERPDAQLLRRRAEAARRALRDRAGGGRGPHGARDPHGRAPRRGRAGREAGGAALPPRGGARQDRRPAAPEEARGDRREVRGPARPARGAGLGDRLRRHGGHRASLPPPGRGGDAVLRDGRRPDGRRPGEGREPATGASRSGTGTRWARSGSRSQSSRRPSPISSAGRRGPPWPAGSPPSPVLPSQGRSKVIRPSEMPFRGSGEPNP